MSSSRLLPQVVAAFAATLGALAFGTTVAWSSAALPSLQDCGDDDCDLPFKLTEEEGSWLTSLLFVGAAVASPIVGRGLLPSIGCRWSMIVLSVPFVLGWTCMIIAKPLQVTSPLIFYVARVIIGFAGGAFAFVGPTYVAETAEVKYRGALSSLMQLMITVGIALVNALAIHNALGWFQISAICLVIPGVVFICMLLMPNSPTYLTKKGRHEEARRALLRLRGKNYDDVDAELESIKESVNSGEDDDVMGGTSFTDLFTSPTYLKPLVIAILILFFQQFGGASTVTLYTREIFIKADTGIDTGLGAFLVMIAQVVATVVSVLVVEKLGRRILLISSIAVDGICITGLGVYFYLDENSGPNGLVTSQTVEHLSWLPLVCLIGFIVAFSLGFGPLAWTMNVELHPRESQSVMPSIATGCCWAFAFCVGKFGTNISSAINQSGLYFLNGAVCLLGTFFCIFFVPETKGKSPEDMKAYFQNGGWSRTRDDNGSHYDSTASVAPIVKS